MITISNLLILTSILLGFLFIRREFHRSLYRVMWRLTGSENIAYAIYLAVFLPGVALHEVSHWLAAKALRVRTYAFSLMPKRLAGGEIRLGYVEIANVDPLRKAIIGLAPALFGTSILAAILLGPLGFNDLFQHSLLSHPYRWLAALGVSLQQPDFLFWVYLSTVIASTMLPSSSDRGSWWALAVLIVIFGLSLQLGGPSPGFAHWFQGVLHWTMDRLIVLLGLAAVFHLIGWLPLLLGGFVIDRLTG